LSSARRRLFFQTAFPNIVEVDATSGVSMDPDESGYSPTRGRNGGIGESVAADAFRNSDATNPATVSYSLCG
jgi:hypothetical protein